MSNSSKKERERRRKVQEEKTTDKQSKKTTKGNLLEHYSNETCSHVEAAISLFFGLIGTLILITIVETVVARAVLSLMYFVLGVLGAYFYVRLFYYRKMLEGILLDESYKDYHLRFQSRILKESRLISLTQRISRSEKGYRMFWAWFMLALAMIVAFFSWAMVVFSL